MSTTVAVADLQVGMFIHLDLGWWAHPFALSSFKLSSPEQIAAIRGLGLSQVRWSPEKSDRASEPVDAKATEQPESASAAPAGPLDLEVRRRARDRAAAQLCERQFTEATQAWQRAALLASEQPVQARAIAEGLSRSLVDKMLGDDDLCIRVVSAGVADSGSAHALNVGVLAMLLARVFGFDHMEMQDLGVGALMHDIGKVELPERVRHLGARADAHPDDHAAYRDHVARGVQLGKRMGLSAPALLVIGQHHEMADGSGFPQQLSGERIALAARIVALTNHYDRLCNPAGAAGTGHTPHEALSLIFAQSRGRFDTAILNAFIRMMGVYPPGSVVQLTDDRYAMVTTVNSSRPLKPRILVHDAKVPAEHAPLLNLDRERNLGIRRSVRPQQLPPPVLDYLAPRARVAYFFEPAEPAEPAAEPGLSENAREQPSQRACA